MAMPKKHIKTFTAKDGDGIPHTLHVLQDVVTRARGLQRNKPVFLGLREIVTSDGRSVNRVVQGQYEIVVTGQILTSSDPDAP